MKRLTTSIFVVAVLSAFVLSSCAKDGAFEKGDFMDGGFTPGAADASGETGEPGDENGQSDNAGKLTAGEWNDLDNWQFWSKLMRTQGDPKEEVEDGEYYEGDGTFYEYCPYWKVYTQNRVAVNVMTSDKVPVAGAKVQLMRNGEKVWEAVTDNLGQANCWIGLFEPTTLAEEDKVTISINGKEQSEAPAITSWYSESTAYNEYIVDSPVSVSGADIAFFVDATGSMTDEIDFLKADLADIFNKVDSKVSAKIRTAALFYRDDGDEYLVKSQDFSESVAKTASFVSEQKADGGGDYPEAVDTALENGLQNLSWSESARSKIVFMLLDAPAHHRSSVIASLQKSMAAYAKAGIKIIPVAASGVDKNTEFMLRFFAISTSGTYVFLTNDSGIGGDHIVASVGDYEVELLNELIVRLIVKYVELPE